MNCAYVVVIEKGPTSYGAYMPDLPGCVAVAESEEEVVDLIREAAIDHIDMLRQNGEPVPEPTSTTQLVNV